MGVADWIVIGIIVLILGTVIGYIIRAKRNGAKCIGCPVSKTCGSKNNADSAECCCGCSGENK